MHLKLRAPYENLLTLANAITLTSLACAVAIITHALAGGLAYLGTLFIVCLVCDGADGFVARRTGTASDLGTQLDSLTDALAFGVTPVVVANTFLRSIGEHAFLPAEIAFCACSVIRLAIFNVQKDKSIFLGLNTPSAAALVIGFVIIAGTGKPDWDARTMYYVLNGLLIVVAASMISPFRYLSSKSLKLRMNLWTVIVGALIVVLSVWFSPYSVYAFLIVYALSGPVAATGLLLRRLRRAPGSRRN
ncbi:CDP-alcohol phosphatidyltransferase family protein [Luteibacter sp.]|uniref:CDP-alcohol phosphatidyltransferase family protein n=1 Tax=Luteibacter sp. TaxID=1886636 RepID=UPI0025C689CA|nr:CDP-alcohol phosphatidyltransferase family protein [Luteibacter sp.]